MLMDWVLKFQPKPWVWKTQKVATEQTLKFDKTRFCAKTRQNPAKPGKTPCTERTFHQN